eukprot:TRINITY_DN27366_c0_g1_i1.p1 TRINITY_DN27366_c0_g1~~TRINITY_DN27366_c0_g1_i1.p1  ORF type:complete len:227 (+),score=29.38 TRINITY_DN27366_c0_g1_i1:54-734(+)
MVLYVSDCSDLPLDIWRSVLGCCDLSTIVAMMSVNKSMQSLCSEDYMWNRLVLRTHGVQAKKGMGYDLCRYFATNVPSVIPVSLKNTDAPDWGTTFRCELMLKPEGVFCTATGVVRANVVVSHTEKFVLTHVKAKGAGWGFSSPLKKFSIVASTNTIESPTAKVVDGTTLGPFTLSDPTQGQEFKLDQPIVTKDCLIQLIEGAQKEENIDTEYVFVCGHSIPQHMV